MAKNIASIFSPPQFDPQVVSDKIKLELGEPSEKEGKWSVTATATVTDFRGAPLSGVEIQFYDNSRKVDDPEETEADGRATKEITDLGKGWHTIESVIVGSAQKSTKKKEIKDSGKPKTPARLAVEPAERDGNYVLSISVMTEEKVGIKGARIRIMDPHSPKIADDVDADEKGSYLHHLNFTENSRTIKIVIPGTELVWEKNLLGPRR